MNRSTQITTLLPLLLAIAASGCASSASLGDDERLALYRGHAGEPVDSIQYLGSYNGWTPLGDGALALWTRPSQAWLIQLYEPCVDIEYAQTIGVPNQNGRLSARFDRIHVANNGLIPLSCTIREIRPIDVKAVRAAEKDARAQRQVEALPAGSGPASMPPSGTSPSGTSPSGMSPSGT